jgi:hypothetical protein
LGRAGVDAGWANFTICPVAVSVAERFEHQLSAMALAISAASLATGLSTRRSAKKLVRTASKAM